MLRSRLGERVLSPVRPEMEAGLRGERPRVPVLWACPFQYFSSPIFSANSLSHLLFTPRAKNFAKPPEVEMPSFSQQPLDPE